jgi:hypothetical protein
MGVGGQRHAPAALSRERDPRAIAQEAGWAPGQVPTGCTKLPHNGMQSPDRTARNESLYKIRYAGPQVSLQLTKFKEGKQGCE